MKKILIKLTTAGGKVIKSISQEHNAEVQKSFEELVEEVPEMKYFKLNTDNGPTYIYRVALISCVIEIIIYKGADKS